MTVLHLILFQIILMQLVGPCVAILMGVESFFYQYLLRDRNIEFLYQSVGWTFYAIIVLTILFQFVLNNKIVKYVDRPLVENNVRFYYKLWVLNMIAATICLLILLYQIGFYHPIMDMIYLDYFQLTIRRKEISDLLNMGIYSIGLQIFAAFALYLSIIIIKNKYIIITTVVFMIIFASITLAKSPIADTMLQIIMCVMLTRKINFQYILKYILLGIFILFLLYGIMHKGTEGSVQILLEGLLARLFIGEFGSLPSYFEVFQDRTGSLMSMLPPYLQSIFGINEESISKTVIEAIYMGDPEKIMTAGYANTFFVGSAFAYGGIFGLVISPFIVFANFFFIFTIFTKFKKNTVNIFFLGYFIYRLSKSVFSDIGYFIISGIQIMLILFLLFRLITYILRIITNNNLITFTESNISVIQVED